MVFTASDFTINGIAISLIHNLPIEGKNNIEDALLVWYGSAPPTSENFCDFINDKREKGLCNYYAFPDPESFNEWIQTTEEEVEFRDFDDTEDNDIEGFIMR
jgi:hypothetical protein